LNDNEQEVKENNCKLLSNAIEWINIGFSVIANLKYISSRKKVDKILHVLERLS